ncbi:MAG: DNRLRE domain-containing protein [Clostridia bacterium]|nr:DNRLRE domain-containing protein [Clostridia bacterium]
MKRHEKQRVVSGAMAVAMTGSAFAGMPSVLAATPGDSIGASADTYVHNNSANPKGEMEYAVLGSSTGKIPAGINYYNDGTEEINIAYLTFDISGINVNELDDAALKLTIAENAAAAEGAEVSVFEAQNGFDEKTAVWEGKPLIIDRVKEQGTEEDNITDQDAVAAGTVTGEQIEISGLGKTIKAAKAEGKSTITFAVYLNSASEIKVAAKESTTYAAPSIEVSLIDRDAVKKAEDAIMAVPDVTLNNYRSQSLSAARQSAVSAYNALTYSEKMTVNDEAYTKLSSFYDDVAWEKTLADYENAENIINAINAIDSAAMTGENYTGYKQQIEAVRSAYDNASFRTKAVIGNKTYQLLVNAENKYSGFESIDVAAIKDKINTIGEVLQENYLDKGKYITDARQAYDKYYGLMKAAYTKNGVLDEAGFNEKMSDLSAELAVLEAAETAVEGFKQVTAAEFVSAWNVIRDTVLESDTDNIQGKEEALNEFESGYYSSPVNNLSLSVYYNDFASGNVTGEAATAIEEYLCARYQLAVDMIIAEYGDPAAPDFNERFDDAEDGSNLYIYLYEYRAAAEEAYEKLSDTSKETYKAQSDYCDAVYEAMMNLVDAKTRNILSLELGDAVLTKEYIDAVNNAKTERDSVPKAIIDYLNKYDPVHYNQYIEKCAMLESKISDLAGLALDEVNKYSALCDSIDEYGLDYMSGYTVSGDEGTKDDSDKYWSIDDDIRNFDETYKSINPVVVIEDGSVTILEYYYNTMLSESEAAAKNAELAQERAGADVRLTAFKSHNDDIVKLREVSAACKEDIYKFGLMLSASEIEAIAQAGTYDEAIAKLDEIIAVNPDISTDDVKELFVKLYGEMETDEASYVKLTTAYRAKYSSEGFTDISEPYISAAMLADWNTVKTTLLPLFCADPDVVAAAENWALAINELYDIVYALDKEQEYLENDFAGVYDCQNRLKTLKEQYDAFDDMVKYYISSGIINSADNTDRYTELDVILNTQWPAAIAVMDEIDAADAAVLTEEWYAKLIAAESSLAALEANDAPSYSHVAEAAKEKLARIRSDYKLFDDFAKWAEDVAPINYPIKEYAQLYTYVYEDDNTPVLVPSQLSTEIDRLAAEEELLYSRLEAASDTLKDYIEAPENGYAAISMSIAKLVKEKNLALDAEKLDKRIISLDELTGTEFVNELEALRAEIDALVDTISYEGEDKRGNDAAILFNMLTQYSKYETYVNNYDKSIADSFAALVDAIGTITYTTDLDAASAAIAECDALLSGLNDAQEKYAYDSIIRLGVLKSRYNKIYAAKEGAQEVLADITEMCGTLADTELKADPYDYEFVKLISGYNDVIAASDVVNASIDAIADTDAYQYLMYNGYIESYGNALADFKDKYAYIGVMQAIEVLYEDSKEVIEITTDEDGNEIVNINEEEKAILIEETKNVCSLYFALDDELKSSVLNYSSLQWLVKNIDFERVGGIIASIKALPSPETITYAKYIGAVESIKAAYDALLSENQARVQADDGGATYEKLTAILVKMAMLAEEYGELGGRPGDVNGDDVVDINDVILMVDYAFGLKDIETQEDEKQFLRGNLIKENEVSEEKIDFHDIAAVIDLLDFNN